MGAIDKSGAVMLRALVTNDDLYQDACEDATFLNLVVAGRHHNIQFMTLGHILYQPRKNSKTIALNVALKIFFEKF